jgi:hypothetical protein
VSCARFVHHDTSQIDVITSSQCHCMSVITTFPLHVCCHIGIQTKCARHYYADFLTVSTAIHATDAVGSITPLSSDVANSMRQYDVHAHLFVHSGCVPPPRGGCGVQMRSIESKNVRPTRRCQCEYPSASWRPSLSCTRYVFVAATGEPRPFLPQERWGFSTHSIHPPPTLV